LATQGFGNNPDSGLNVTDASREMVRFFFEQGTSTHLS
jgi:hypothetical protein